MSFADFKKRSQSSINELTKKIEETNKKESYTDDRFWRPELDKSSNGFAGTGFTNSHIPISKIAWGDLDNGYRTSLTNPFPIQIFIASRYNCINITNSAI